MAAMVASSVAVAAATSFPPRWAALADGTRTAALRLPSLASVSPSTRTSSATSTASLARAAARLAAMASSAAMVADGVAAPSASKRIPSPRSFLLQ